MNIFNQDQPRESLLGGPLDTTILAKYKQKQVTKNFMDASIIGGATVPDSGATSMSRFDNDMFVENRSDPTYLGFSLEFDVNVEDYQDVNGIPSALFMNENSPDSAIGYLEATGYPEEAKMLRKFKEGIIKLQVKTPWYFTKVSGLDTVYKIDPTKPTRVAKDTKISISMLGDINMEVTYLFDLYKKAVFDTKNMRWRLPDYMRWFDLTIYIFDVRDIQKAYDYGMPANALGGIPPAIAKTSAALASQVVTAAANPDGSGNSVASKVVAAGQSLFGMREDDLDLPILKLSLLHCEFNVLQDGIGITDLTSSSESMFEFTLGIDVKKVKEINYFNGFGFVGEDLLTSATDSNIKGTDNTDVIRRVKEIAETDAIISAIGGFVENALIGNVYGISPGDIRGTIQNAVNNAKTGNIEIPENIGFTAPKKTTENGGNVEVAGNVNFTTVEHDNPKSLGSIGYEENKEKYKMPDNIGFTSTPS